MNQKLRKAMDHSGETQVELADVFGVTQPTISRWLEDTVPAWRVKQVAKHFKVTPHWLSPDTH